MPYILEGFSLCPPSLPNYPWLAPPGTCCPSSTEVQPSSRELDVCVVLQPGGQPLCPTPLQPCGLMGMGGQWLLRLAGPQEIVENSLSRTSWLSVWKARFLRTLVLMDRTWEGVGAGRRTQAERKEESVITNSRGQHLGLEAMIQC